MNYSKSAIMRDKMTTPDTVVPSSLQSRTDIICLPGMRMSLGRSDTPAVSREKDAPNRSPCTQEADIQAASFEARWF